MRPTPYCVCAHIQRVEHKTQVLVLQHPDEHKHPLNTARLAVLGLARAECWVGVEFPMLAQRLASVRTPVLLFPGPQARTPRDWLEQNVVNPKAPAATTAPSSSSHAPDLLIVPDGTWRQAGRLVRGNPVLDELPRLALEAGEPSRYRVRRAERDAAVSTIEAIVRTLAVLEPETDFQPVLRPFEAMIEGQIRAMGEQAYARHLALTAQSDSDSPAAR